MLKDLNRDDNKRYKESDQRRPIINNRIQQRGEKIIFRKLNGY